MTARRFAALALALAAPLAPASAQSPPAAPAASSPPASAEQDEAIRLVDLWLDASRAFDRVPGLSAGIVTEAGLVWAKGYGSIDAEGSASATPATVYSICSISKVLTALSVMRLAEAGRIDIDAPLQSYLPWARLRPADPSSGPVTLRAVLTHSAGLPREAEFHYWAGPDFTFPTREQLRATVGEQQMLYGVYSQYQYSNLGLALAGEVVEAVSGRSYVDEVRSAILEPLGMRDTTAPLPRSLYGTRMAIGYGAITREGTRDRLPPFDTRALTPAAGYVSTVEDLGRFLGWQIRLLGQGNREIVPAATLREMQRVQYMSPDWNLARGLGFGIYRVGNRTYVGHSGECPGYFTTMMLDPARRIGTVVMMNAAQSTGPYWRGMHALLGKRRGVSHGSAALDAAALEAYAGRYSPQPWRSEGVIVPWGGGLAHLSLPSGNPAEDLTLLRPSGPDRFRRVREDDSLAEEVVFERDASGKVVRLVWHGNPNERTGDLPPAFARR